MTVPQEKRERMEKKEVWQSDGEAALFLICGRKRHRKNSQAEMLSVENDHKEEGDM